MADRLEILSQRLIKHLEDRRDSLGPQCLPVSRLETYLTGDLSPDEWEEVKAHLDSCLSCFYATVQLDDLLRGVADTVTPEPGLKAASGEGISRSPAAIAWAAIRGALEWKGSAAWGFAGALAGIILTLAVFNLTRDKAQDIARPVNIFSGIPQSTFRVTSPPEIQKVIGVVSVVKQSTQEGMPYHQFRMKGDDGKTYQILSWGNPVIQANDRIEVDAIVKPQPLGDTEKFYSGVAYRISRMEQAK